MSEHYHEIMKRYMFPPDGGEWPDPLDENSKSNFDTLYKEIVLHWVDNEFDQASKKDELVEAAANALAVVTDAGGTSMDSVKTMIRYFTLKLTEQHRRDVVNKILSDRLAADE
jgi:hypothetical protein